MRPSPGGGEAPGQGAEPDQEQLQISNPRVSHPPGRMAASSPMKNSRRLAASPVPARRRLRPQDDPASPARLLSAPAQPAQIDGTHQFHGGKSQGWFAISRWMSVRPRGGGAGDGEGDAKGRPRGRWAWQAGAQDECEIRVRLGATRWTRPRSETGW